MLLSWLFPQGFQNRRKCMKFLKNHKDFNFLSKRPFYLGPRFQMQQQNSSSELYICHMTNSELYDNNGFNGTNHAIQVSIIITLFTHSLVLARFRHFPLERAQAFYTGKSSGIFHWKKLRLFS